MARSANLPDLSDEQFHTIARALADPRRFAMLQQIAGNPVLACSALHVQAEISPATISHHIKELSEAGLIDTEREGRTMYMTFRRDLWQAYCRRLEELGKNL